MLLFIVSNNVVLIRKLKWTIKKYQFIGWEGVNDVKPLLNNGVSPYYANVRDMRLNPTKCKVMLFDFLHYRLPINSPLSIGAHAVESVESLKLLGVHFSRNLTWSVHCDKIIKKANKRLCIIYQVRKAGYSTKELVSVYCTLIRPILEYAAPVWSVLPSCLAADIKMVQKRAMCAIFWPIKLSYNVSLEAANLLPLKERQF